MRIILLFYLQYLDHLEYYAPCRLLEWQICWFNIQIMDRIFQGILFHCFAILATYSYIQNYLANVFLVSTIKEVEININFTVCLLN